MTELETLHEDAVLRIVSSRNVLVNVWSSAPTIAQVRAFARAGTAVTRRHPRGAGLINLALRGRASFSEEVREELVKLMKQGLFRLGAAHIVLVGGFTGTAVRAFMSTMILLSRPAVPHKVFGDPKAAAAWLAPLLTGGTEAWSAAEITGLLQQLTPR
jgi:hypothetical protein